MVKDKEEALDILQECFVRVSKSVRNLRERKKFKPWLMKIVTNLCLNHLRRRCGVELVSLSEPVRSQGEDLPRQVAGNCPIPSQVLENGEVKEKLWQAISSLAPKELDVFTLRCIEGLSCKETASAVHCSQRTVRYRLAQAKRFIGDRVARDLKTEVKKRDNKQGKVLQDKSLSSNI